MEKKLLEELKNEKSLYKFNAHSTEIKLSTGKTMSSFFRANKKLIEESNDPICIDIMKQYKDYVLNNCCEAKYDYYLKKFEEIKDHKKFEVGYNGKFSDGKSIYSFFEVNKERILNSDDEISKKIKNSYRTYLTYLRIQKMKERQALINIEQRKKEISKNKFYNSKCFISRLNAFKNIETLDKFRSLKVCPVYLKDGITANYFWHSNKNYILNNESEICKEIKAQYEKYEIQREIEKKLIKNKRMEEFKKLSFEKFMNSGNTTFEDGKRTYFWWIENKNLIVDSSDEICQEIITQYDCYVSMTDGLKPNEIFEDDIILKLDSMYL